MKEIALTKGFVALVDDADYERVSALPWSANVKSTVYARRGVYDPAIQNNHSLYMQHFILGLPSDQRIDHRDGNGLNNQRENLRPCTRKNNNRAFRKKAKGKTSRFRGVFWNKQLVFWNAKIMVNGRSFHLGLFDSEEKAARAYDAAARQHFGEFASPNFST